MGGDVHSAHDATLTHDCKTFGCTGIARANRGRYAYLCDDCKTAAISRERDERAERHQAATPPPAAPPTEPDAEPQPEAGEVASLAAATSDLAVVSKALEDAVQERALARQRVTETVETFNECLHVKAAAEQLLTGKLRGDDQ